MSRDGRLYGRHSDDLTEFLSRYELGALRSFKGIAEGVENSNFLLHTAGGSFILTLYEKRVAADLPFFLGLMEHLAARGITCPQPVKDKTGGVLGTLTGRPAAIVTFLDGLWIRRPNADHCAAVGEALARLHLAGTDFPARARMRCPSTAGGRSTSTPARAATACGPACAGDRQGTRRAGKRPGRAICRRA